MKEEKWFQFLNFRKSVMFPFRRNRKHTDGDDLSPSSFSVIISELCRIEKTTSLTISLPVSCSIDTVVPHLSSLLINELISYIEPSLSASVLHSPLECYTAVLGLLRTSCNQKVICQSDIPAICAFRIAVSLNDSDSSISDLAHSTIKHLILSVIFSSFACKQIPLSSFTDSFSTTLIKLSPLSALIKAHNRFIESNESDLSTLTPCCFSSLTILCKVFVFAFASHSSFTLSLSQLGTSDSELTFLFVKFLNLFTLRPLDHLSPTLTIRLVHTIASITAVLITIPGCLGIFIDQEGLSSLTTISYYLFNTPPSSCLFISAISLPSRDFAKWILNLSSNDRFSKFECSLSTCVVMCIASLLILSHLSILYSRAQRTDSSHKHFLQVIIIKVIHAIVDSHPSNLFVCSTSCPRAIASLFSSVPSLLNAPVRKSLFSLLSSISRSAAGCLDMEGRVDGGDVALSGIAEMTALASVLNVVNQEFLDFNYTNYLDFVGDFYTSFCDGLRSFSKASAMQLSVSLGESGVLTQSIRLAASYHVVIMSFDPDEPDIPDKLVSSLQALLKFISIISVHSIVLPLILSKDCFSILRLMFVSHSVIQSSSATAVQSLVNTICRYSKEDSHAIVSTYFFDCLLGLIENVTSSKIKSATSLLLFIAQAIEQPQTNLKFFKEGILCSNLTTRLFNLFISNPLLSDSISICMASVFNQFHSLYDSLVRSPAIESFIGSPGLVKDLPSEVDEWVSFFNDVTNSQQFILQLLRMSSGSPRLENHDDVILSSSGSCILSCAVNILLTVVLSNTELVPLTEELLDIVACLACKPSVALYLSQSFVHVNAIHTLLELYSRSDDEFEIIQNNLEGFIVAVFSNYSDPFAVKLLCQRLLSCDEVTKSFMISLMSRIDPIVPTFLVENSEVLLSDASVDPFELSDPSIIKKVEFSNSFVFSAWMKISTTNFKSSLSLLSEHNNLFAFGNSR
ncbi:hypothetical protein GEMRC1_001999 [Eukaryota sp. GEM-RC1]